MTKLQELQQLARKHKGRPLEQLLGLGKGEELTPIENARLNKFIEETSTMPKKETGFFGKLSYGVKGITGFAVAKATGGWDKVKELAEQAEEKTKFETILDAQKAIACLQIDHKNNAISDEEYAKDMAEIQEFLDREEGL